MAKRESFETYGLEQKPYATDHEADACRCHRCLNRPQLRVVASNEVISISSEMRKVFGLLSDADEQLEAALRRLSEVEARMSIFRDEALSHGG